MENAEERLPNNIYDRIFKENAETIFIPLIERKLEIRITHFRPLKEKLLSTIEREMDFLYEVDTDTGKNLLLHIEFQTQDNPEMLYRMEEYHGLLRRKYRREIEHVVIYLGTEKSRMRTRLAKEEQFTGFDLISIHDLNTTDLLASQVPEVVILAILSNYEPERTESVLRLILGQLKALCKTSTELKKYISQLLILSRLRKLESLTTEIVSDMPITYDITTDGLYQKGIVVGLEKGIEKAVRKLLMAGLLSPEGIAGLLEIDLKSVLKIQAEIDAGGQKSEPKA